MGAATAEAAAVGESREGTDGFDKLPDHLVIHILNLVEDARSLARCRPVCRRLNALVPQADRLLVRVDAVAPIPSGMECFLVPLLRSALQSLSRLVSSNSKRTPAPPLQRSPVEIVRGFERVRRLAIELPGGDLRLEKGAVVRWKAEFGRRLRRCAILAGGEGGIKERVIWTVGVVMSASARHYMAREVVRGCGGGGGKEAGEMEQVVVTDRDGEGTLVMDRECVHGGEAETEGWREERRRTTVPAVRMRMRCVGEMEVGGGVRLEGATLVVLRAAEGGGAEEEGLDLEAEEWAKGAFEGAFRCAAEELLKTPGYSLEMNSF